MTREFFPELPKNLPVRRDRTSIYDLYHEYDRLWEEYGWEKHLLFEQYVRLPNRPAALVPIFYYHTPITGPAVGIISGVHGKKEPAGPMAIASEIETIAEIGKTRAFFVIALLNASYIKNQRFPDTLPGSHKTRSSIGDFDHVLPQKKRPHVARSPEPANPYVENLVPKLLKIVREYSPVIIFDLHEDFPYPYERKSWGKTHIYSDGRLGLDDPLARRCAAILIDYKVPLRMHTKNGSSEESSRGISTLNNGSLDNFFAARQIILDGELRPGPNAPVVITIETPTEFGGRQIPLEKRVFAQAAIIRAIPQLLKIYGKNIKKYSS